MCRLYKRKIKKLIRAMEEFRKRLEDEDLGLTADKLIAIDDMTPEEAYILGTKDTMDNMLKHLKN